MAPLSAGDRKNLAVTETWSDYRALGRRDSNDSASAAALAIQTTIIRSGPGLALGAPRSPLGRSSKSVSCASLRVSSNSFETHSA